MVDSTGVIEDFIGIKIGDLNKSVVTNAISILPRSSAFADVTAVDRYVSPGEEFEVTLDMSSYDQQVLGGQWEIMSNNAKIIEIIPLAADMSPEMMYADDFHVRCSWVTLQPERVSSLMTIRFVALAAGKVSDMITLENTFLNSEVYNDDQEVYNLQLSWREEASVVSDEIQLHQNRPNPWDIETVIPFELPEEGDVILSITNAIGEEVTTIVRHFHSGKQQFKLINDSWPAGMYYYTLRFGDSQLTKTMLILNKR
jgi:hypothetical protein